MHDYTHTTAESVKADVDRALAAAEELIANAVASVDAPSFDATLRPIDLAGAAAIGGYGKGAFMAYVHPEATVRDAGQAAEEQIAKWNVGLPFREDLYRAVRAFAETDEAAALEGEQKRLLQFWLRDFRRAGHELPPADKATLESLRHRLVELEVAFARNINDDQAGIEVTREGLAGLPEAYIERLEPGSQPGTYKVSIKGPEITPFMQQAHDRELREKLFRRNWTSAMNNRPLLEEALGIRHRIAQLFGLPTWAHYALQIKMAGSPERVEEFYAEIVPPLRAAAAREVAQLQERAERDGLVGPIQAWDWVYYDNKQAREEHGVDQNEVSQYLPLEPVIDGMFALTGQVFGLEYRKVPDARAWHPDVTLYEIHDKASGEMLAHFYADLFPREGKFYHAAAFPLVIGHRNADGTYEKPMNAIVANLTPPSADRPSLLRHGPRGEIVTLFHEFGHILHQSLTRAESTRFSGAETERDFVEGPSQIMEHWVWEPSILARFARHYETGEPLPDDLVAKMMAGEYLNVGLRAAWQVSFGAEDMAMHASAEPVDIDTAMREAFAVTSLPYPEGTCSVASFGHLMGGYDAGYYGYLWAEVIGDDLWGRFLAEGITSPAVGQAYRRAILEPNGTRSGDDMVADFLGRPASVQNYLRVRNLI
ncbi:MAG: Zn-dependent oligopeptidase [Chloroflexota bacterium]|nr:Zn-dependent oligopeptidase [Chloroflexota bacterium]